MNKILVDTNVLVYAIDEDSKYFTPAQQIILAPDLELYTTSKNLSEFLSVITRSSVNALSIPDAIIVINELKTILSLLYPTEKSCEIFLDLVKKYQPIGLRIHDFEIVGIGLASGVDHIATFNEKDFVEIKEISLYSM